jgi:hypothetical protein
MTPKARGRFKKVLGEVISGLASGWQQGAQQATRPTEGPTPERFVMKPGEVRIIKGGGTPITRRPGEPRDVD